MKAPAKTITVADLEAERAGLPAATEAARRAGDTGELLRLAVRGDDLPAEIRQARRAELPGEIETAWATAERCHRDRVAADSAVAAAHAEQLAAARIVAELPRGPATLQSVRDDEVANASRAREHYLGLLGPAKVAHQAVTGALVAVGQLELELEHLTGQPPVDGDGLRALPGVLTRGYSAAASDDHFGEVLYVAMGCTDASAFFAAGTVPPRWLAYWLDDRFFAPTVNRPSPSERPGEVMPEARWDPTRGLSPAQFGARVRVAARNAAAERERQADTW